MAFDTNRKLIVLRGGTRSNRDRPPDTWEWDGRCGTARADPRGNDARTPARNVRALAYDRARKRVMLYGNTWEWDGARWLEMRPR